MTNFLLAFSLAFAITIVSVPLVRRLAARIGAVDMPNARKIHKKPLPRIGGIAIFVGFVVPFVLLLPLDRAMFGLLSGLVLVFVIGLIDDIKGLGPITKLGGQVVAAGLVLSGGIGIVAVTDPFNGLIHLDNLRIPMEVAGFEFNILPLANAVSILWIVGIINTVNFLDGMDGLAAGVVAITAVVIAIITGLALAPVVNGIAVALIATILVGACCGFLVYNWHPSSIIMGDSGAYTLGLILAVIAIYGGSKIGVGILVLGVAIIDSAWAITRRLYRRRSIFSPDRGHIHHALLDTGLTQLQVVTHLYIVAIAVGLAVIFAGAYMGFFVLLLALVITVSMLRVRQRKA